MNEANFVIGKIYKFYSCLELSLTQSMAKTVLIMETDFYDQYQNLLQ